MASLAALFTANTAGEKYQSKGTCNIVCIVYFTMETNILEFLVLYQYRIVCLFL